MSRHIRYKIPASDQDYHRKLRGALLQLVLECQAQHDETRPLSVLDVGSGRGELLNDLRRIGVETYGTDIDDQCIAMSSEYGEISKVNIYQLSEVFPPTSFDVVVCSHVLEHLESPKQGIEQLKRVSRKHLILAVPNLARMGNLKLTRRQPIFVNRGHQVGWDTDHF